MRWAQRITSASSGWTSTRAIMWRPLSCTIGTVDKGATGGRDTFAAGAAVWVAAIGASSVARILQFWSISFEETCDPPGGAMTLPAGSLDVIDSWSVYTDRMMSTWSPGTISVPTPFVWSISMANATMPGSIAPLMDWPSTTDPALKTSVPETMGRSLAMSAPAILPTT